MFSPERAWTERAEQGKEPIFINTHQQAPSLLCHLILTTALRGRRHEPIFQKKTESKFVKQLAYDGKPVRQRWGAQPCALGPWSLLRHIMLSHVMLGAAGWGRSGCSTCLADYI